MAGVVHVWNPSRGSWGPDEWWTVEELWRIGGTRVPEEELFSGPLLTTAAAPNGEVHVLDSEAELLSIFSADGEFIRHVGGPGRGPGEFVAPSALTWDGLGRLWVADGFGGRYHVFSPEGEFIRTHPRPVQGLARLQHPLLYLPDGALLDEASRFPDLLFLKVDTTGPGIDTLGALVRPRLSAAVRAIRIRPGSDFQKVSRLYVNRGRWALAPDGTLWTAETGALRLVQRTLAGDTLRVIHTEHRPAHLSESDNRVIERGLSAAGLSRSDLQAVRPVLQQLVVLEDGHVLVQIETKVGEDGRIFDVFDPVGRYLGPMDMGFAPASRGVMTFRGDTLLAPVLGRWDVPYVVKAVIRRAGIE